MATIKGKLKTKSGDIMYPETSADKVTGLATVATTGAYADLTGKPTIPSDVKVRQYQRGSNAAGTSPNYPILTRYNLTNKNGSYDNSYAQYHTGVTINTTTGTLNAPAITVNGTAVLTSHQSLSNYVTLNSTQTITAKKTITTGAGTSGLDVQISGSSAGTNLSSVGGGFVKVIGSNNSDYLTMRPTGFSKMVYGSGSSSYSISLPNKSGEIALTSDAKDTLTWDGHIFNILDNSNVELSYYGHASYTPHTGRLHFNGIFMVRTSNSEGDNIFSFQISNLTSKIGWDIPYNFTKYSIVGANYWLGKATYGSSSINSSREDNGGIVGFYNGGTGVKHLCFARLYDLAGGGIGPWNMSYLYGIPIQVNFELFVD